MDLYRPHNTPAASRRQQQIEDCLLQNMLQMPYQAITIADLCRQMGISRRLFYTYFRDKDSCLYSLIDRMIADSFLDSLPEGKVDLLISCTLNMEFWKRNRIFLDVIIRQNLGPLFRDRNLLFFIKDENILYDLLSTSDMKVDTDIITSYVAIRISLLFSWHSRGFDTPAQEMAKKYIRMIQSPMLQSDDAKIAVLWQNIL